MPTIEELFKSKKLASGQTAKQKYEVQNIADLPRTPYNVLMQPSFKIAEIGRRNVTNRTKETKLEEELSGLRILATTTSPFLYGTDIVKFTTKSRSIVTDMKNSANNISQNSKVTTVFPQGSAGKLSTFLNKAENLGKNLLSKIGAKLPQELIPSRIVLNSDFNKAGGEYNTMVTLSNLKSDSGGNLLGNFINDNLKGKPSANQILGSALDLGKKKLNNLLLGSPSQAAVNFAKAGGTIYDSTSAYSKVMTGAQYLSEDLIDLRKDLSTKLNNYEVNQFNLPLPITNYVSVPNVVKNVKTKFSKSGTLGFIPGSIEATRKITKGSDFLNTKVAYPSKDGKNYELPDKTFLDDYDFIPLKFWSVSRKAAVNFRAIISGLSETFSPTWDTNRFVGNPFNFYIYNTIERSVSFNFKVYSLSYNEHIAAWQRLSFLSSLTYPQDYISGMAVVPPFITFTLGDMYNAKEGFIESLSYTIDDNTPWEIGIDANTKNWKLPKVIDVSITIKMVETVGSTYQPATYKQTIDEKTNKPAVDNKKNPILGIDKPAEPKALYGYGGLKSGTPPTNQIKENTTKTLHADGSPKPTETLPEVVVSASRKKKKDENPVAETPKVQTPPAYNIQVKSIGDGWEGNVYANGTLVKSQKYIQNYTSTNGGTLTKGADAVKSSLAFEAKYFGFYADSSTKYEPSDNIN